MQWTRDVNTAQLIYLKGQICMLLLLSYLETWKMGVFQLQTVLLLKILSYRTLHRLPIFQLQREAVRANIGQISLHRKAAGE